MTDGLKCIWKEAVLLSQHFPGGIEEDYEKPQLEWSSLSSRISPLNVNRRSTCFSRWFLAWLILRPWGWTRRVSPKRRLTFNGLRGVIPQTTEFFISTAVRASNPTELGQSESRPKFKLNTYRTGYNSRSVSLWSNLFGVLRISEASSSILSPAVSTESVLQLSRLHMDI
jgi:hypothetical protein